MRTVLVCFTPDVSNNDVIVSFSLYADDTQKQDTSAATNSEMANGEVTSATPSAPTLDSDMNAEPATGVEQTPANGESDPPSEPKPDTCADSGTSAPDANADAAAQQSSSATASDKSSVIVCNGYSESHHAASGDRQSPTQSQSATENTNVNNVYSELSMTSTRAAAEARSNREVDEKTPSNVVSVDEGSMGESMTTESACELPPLLQQRQQRFNRVC